MNTRMRSISVPITLGAVTLPLAAALLVGWTTFLARRVSENFERDMWLIVLGAAAFIVIMTVLVLFSYFLSREILEVRRQNSFIDSVTHELKSPLASIKLCAQTLSREDLPVDKRAPLVAMIHDDVTRLSLFIDDVLQASRLAHGDTARDWRVVDARTLVQVVAAQVVARYKVRSDVVQVAFDATVPRRATDAAALEVIVRNLIDNAVKYSRGKSDARVEVRVTDEAAALRLEVSDNGIGIPPSERKRVFHRFYRVERQEVRQQKGTGLGLFVVSALLRNLDGKIWIAEHARLGGTTFIAIIPAKPAGDGESDRPIDGLH